MAIPDYQTVMLPLLKFTSDGQEHSLLEAVDILAAEFKLTPEEKLQMLPSGSQATFINRIGWARSYLKKAGLLKPTRRGYYQITDRGRSVLKQNPPKINVAYLRQFPEFSDSQPDSNKENRTENLTLDLNDTQTPEEEIENAYQKIKQNLAVELLQTISNHTPAFFERLVIDLLVKMGYGGTRQDAGEAIGKSGDEGIDGIIKEDRLGLDIIYVQAKRWKDQHIVGRPEIQSFVGALQGQHARKGIFITTSNFSQAARDYTSKIESKIVLIDGETLAQLMIDYNVGVAPTVTYELKHIDSDYFMEE